MKAFLTLDLKGVKCELKSVYAADFAKLASSIQEDTEVTWELEVNQVLAEGTKLLRLIFTTPARSDSFERP